MANVFQKVYPPKGRLFFDGGKNNKYERALILDNESPDCKNVVFSNGAVETRGGTAKFNTTSVGSYPCDGLFVRKVNTGNQTMCAWYNGNFYTITGTSTFTTVPSGQSVYTAGPNVMGVQYENYLFMGNGGSTPYKYNGYFTQHGIPEPAKIASAISETTATGTLTGSYKWQVSYVNTALAEGNISSFTTQITLASGKVNLTGIPVGPASYGVYARRIYRSKSNATAFRVTEIADNTTTTYQDNSSDSELGVEASDDNGIPPNYSIIVYHQNRLFVNDPTNPNIIKYSELENPYIFPTLNFVKVGDNTTDLVRAISVYENNIIILCDNSQWLLYMADTTPSNWQLIKIKSSYGCKSPFGIVYYNNKILFPAMQNDKFVGFAAISGTGTELSATLLTINSVGSELKSDRIEPDMFEVTEAYIAGISAVVYKNKAYISVPYGSSASYNNLIYIYDFSISNLSKSQEGSWCPWTGLNAAFFGVYNSKLYYANADSNTGNVYEMNKAEYNDSGAAIDSYFWTKEYSGYPGEEENRKDFRFSGLFYELAGDYFMNYSYRLDSAMDEGTIKQIDLDPGGALWDAAVWDVDEWDSSEEFRETMETLGQSGGKRIQFKFSNQNAVNQKFKVLGMKIFYNMKGKR